MEDSPVRSRVVSGSAARSEDDTVRNAQAASGLGHDLLHPREMVPVLAVRHVLGGDGEHVEAAGDGEPSAGGEVEDLVADGGRLERAETVLPRRQLRLTAHEPGRSVVAETDPGLERGNERQGRVLSHLVAGSTHVRKRSMEGD